MQDAYEKACYANPTIRAKEVAKAQAEAIAKAQKDAQERAAAVKAATAGNVKTSGHQGRGTAPEESMEDTMKATLAGIQKRERK
jgi:cytoskeletal protein RodZ